MSESTKQATKHNTTNFNVGMDTVASIAEEINPLISLLLYICSEEPEIDNSRQPGKHPQRATHKKVKGGWRLFPAEKPSRWVVGERIGQQLRQANQSLSPETGRKVKPHLRKGHWHGFWTGPKDQQQKFIYKWIMPMVVAGEA